MLIDLYKQFSRSLAWNAFESMSYQALLLSHQIALYKVCTNAQYGLIGSLFSGVYLLVTIANFGLDVTLSPFFTVISASKENFKKILFRQFLFEYIFLATTILIGYAAHSYLPSSWKILHTINTSIFLPILLLICFESAKKTLRMILQLSFFNRITALVEIATIITYISTIWVGYFFGYPISLYLVFIPMLCVSIVSSLILALFVYQFYKELPEKNETSQENFDRRFMKSRLFNFLNQVGHMAFSSNFLVPLFALQFGLAQAGLLKLISSITHCISVIVQKVFGVSGSMLFAHVKNNSLESKNEAFQIVSNRLNQALLGVIIFLFINFRLLLNLGSITHNNITFSIVCLFLMISFSENFFIAYEKFYIAQEKADHLFFFNMIIMTLLGFFIVHATQYSQIFILMGIIGIRIAAFSCISLLSFYQWNIKPTFRIQPLYFIWSLAVSIAFYAAMS